MAQAKGHHCEERKRLHLHVTGALRMSAWHPGRLMHGQRRSTGAAQICRGPLRLAGGPPAASFTIAGRVARPRPAGPARPGPGGAPRRRGAGCAAWPRMTCVACTRSSEAGAAFSAVQGRDAALKIEGIFRRLPTHSTLSTCCV